MLDALEHVVLLGRDVEPPTWLDPDGAPDEPARGLIAVGNGILNVGARKLSPHTSRLFVTWSLPFEVGREAGTPKRWLAFLRELWGDDAEAILLLQRIMVDSAIQESARKFAVGSGVAEPQGLITGLVAAGATVAPTTPETFASADVYKVQEALAPRWQGRASWLANLAIWNDMAVMETGNGARPFPELGSDRLLRRPIRELSTMDGAINAAATETNYVLGYGSWRDAFLIADRIGTTVEFVPVVLGANRRPIGVRGLWMWSRTGLRRHRAAGRPAPVHPDYGLIGGRSNVCT